MSIITFWNDNREQSGRTLTSVAVATRLSIERNSKILLISTSFGDSTIKNCFWGETKNKNTAFFNNGKNNNITVDSGIEGLYKMITSNKLTPSIITDYTKVVFKGRLEVITGFSESRYRTIQDNIVELKKIEESYVELIKVANQYYDIVIVDLDKRISKKVQEEILNLSQVNVFILSQRLESINRYNELRQVNKELMNTRCVPVIGKYISNYKYNSKNIARYLGQKQELDLLPFNLLYMEAADEAGVVDLFLKLKNVKDKTDENYIFMQCTLNLTNNIMKKLQDMQMKMR